MGPTFLGVNAKVGPISICCKLKEFRMFFLGKSKFEIQISNPRRIQERKERKLQATMERPLWGPSVLQKLKLLPCRGNFKERCCRSRNFDRRTGGTKIRKSCAPRSQSWKSWTSKTSHPPFFLLICLPSHTNSLLSPLTHLTPSLSLFFLPWGSKYILWRKRLRRWSGDFYCNSRRSKVKL